MLLQLVPTFSDPEIAKKILSITASKI